MNLDIFSLLDEIQMIARNGLNYNDNEYDRERYKRLLILATNTYSNLMDVEYQVLYERFTKETGHITPKVGADAAIFNKHGEILLMDRVDGSGWCLPCGWVEPNEKPIETVKREVLEETGLKVDVKQLVGVFTRMPSIKNGPHTMIAIVHLCEVQEGELTLSHEGLALRYWQIDSVQNWHANHKKFALAAYEIWQSNSLLSSISD